MKKDLLPIDAAIADYLRDGVDESGISYRQIAALTGLSHNRVGIILRKEPPPATIGEMGQIAGVLGMSASSLLARAEAELAAAPEREADDPLAIPCGPSPDRGEDENYDAQAIDDLAARRANVGGPSEDVTNAPLSLEERRRIAAERAAAAAESDLRLVAQQDDGQPKVHEEDAPPTHDEGADPIPDDDHTA